MKTTLLSLILIFSSIQSYSQSYKKLLITDLGIPQFEPIEVYEYIGWCTGRETNKYKIYPLKDSIIIEWHSQVSLSEKEKKKLYRRGIFGRQRGTGIDYGIVDLVKLATQVDAEYASFGRMQRTTLELKDIPKYSYWLTAGILELICPERPGGCYKYSSYHYVIKTGEEIHEYELINDEIGNLLKSTFTKD